MNKSIKIFLKWFLGPLLFLWLSWSVYRQVSNQPDLETHLRQIGESVTGDSFPLLMLVLALMPLNWGLEARKWQVLLLRLHRISYGHAFKAILSGVAFSLNTPNRIGEYGGRVLYIPDGKRGQAISLTIAGSFSQLLVTLFMGAFGLIYMEDRLLSVTGVKDLRIWINVFKWLVLFVATVGLLVYFRMSWLVRGIELIPGIRKFTRYISVLEDMGVTILLRVLSLSAGRFLVFVFQYNMMLRVMRVEMAWWDGFWAICVLFLLLATLPTIALVELGLRWEYSIMLFGLYSANTVGIYAAATGIWLVNLVLPALAGSLFILGVRIFRDP
ncbi:MAG: flippase-like domain-containing protein [Chitinophagaceae bacterium]|nr:flippase-like domain-containing protein [Chitinophagaceae bacterium]